MDNYVNIKMRTGEDIVAQLLSKQDGNVTVKRPLHIMVHPHHGFFVKSWDIFSSATSITIKDRDMIWCTDANDKAIEYYEEFLDQMDNDGDRAQTVEEFNDEIEEQLEAVLQSRHVTKH